MAHNNRIMSSTGPGHKSSGEVDIIPLGKDESGIWVDTEHITTIGYGDNVVEVETENGVKITNF